MQKVRIHVDYYFAGRTLIRHLGQIWELPTEDRKLRQEDSELFVGRIERQKTESRTIHPEKPEGGVGERVKKATTGSSQPQATSTYTARHRRTG